MSVAKAPWIQTVYAFAMVVESERIEREVQNLQGFVDAQRTAMGFHEPQKLWQGQKQALATLRHPPGSGKQRNQSVIDRTVAHIEAMVAAHESKNKPDTPPS